jgi:hypothetical protein
MAAFRNTTNYGIPWNTQEGHSFLQKFSVRKHYTFHSRNWRLKVRATQGFSSNWHQELSEFLQISEANGNRMITNTQTNAHTHTHTQTKWWYPNSYHVNGFLCFMYWIATFSKIRSHWTPRQPGAFHQFPQC